jgi:hypothetical protein
MIGVALSLENFFDANEVWDWRITYFGGWGGLSGASEQDLVDYIDFLVAVIFGNTTQWRSHEAL